VDDYPCSPIVRQKRQSDLDQQKWLKDIGPVHSFEFLGFSMFNECIAYYAGIVDDDVNSSGYHHLSLATIAPRISLEP
jgi:hypothetical protein